jgi:hypothetical protein
MNKVKLPVLIAMGVVGYCAYGLIAYFVDRSQMGGFLALNISMVTGTIGLALRDMQYPNEANPPAPPAAPPKDAP